MFLSTPLARLASTALLGTFVLGFGGIGTAAAASANSTALRSSIDIVSTPAAAAQVGPGSTFTDMFVVSNVGNEAAENVTLTASYDPAQVQLQGVQFSSASAWVTTNMPNGFSANLGRIGSNDDAVTVTAKFMATASYTAGTPLQAQVEANWHDSSNQHSDVASLPMVTAETGQAASAPTTSGTIAVSAGGFNTGEPVTFWYNLPNGSAAPLYVRHGQLVTDRDHEEQLNGTRQNVANAQTLAADSTGQVSSTLSVAGFGTGAYSIVAHGVNSGITVVIPFNV